MAFVAVFQPPPDLWSAVTFITLALFLGIGTGGVFAWVARRAPARSVGSVTGIVAAAGGLGGYFPPLVMGATYDAADNNYTIGLLLLVATALIAFGVHGAAPARPRTSARGPRQGVRHREHHTPRRRADRGVARAQRPVLHPRRVLRRPADRHPTAAAARATCSTGTAGATTRWSAPPTA